jgi:diguanylate cyclase (GGDEF)-like protein/PAS domain S-box-containing protein
LQTVRDSLESNLEIARWACSVKEVLLTPDEKAIGSMEQLKLFTLPSSGMKAALAKSTILVVDDEIGMGESLRMLMTRLGYEVSVANSGEMALREIATRPFDLIITDLVMEGLSGYDILDFVNREGLDIPVIVLTGLGSIDAAVKALKHGAYDYILKPFDLDSFKVSIRRAIEKRQLEVLKRIQERRISSVGSIARAVSSTLSLDEIFHIIVNHCREFIDFDNAALALVAKEELLLDLTAIVLDGKTRPASGERIFLDHPPFSQLISGRRAIIVSAISKEPAWRAIEFQLVKGMSSCTLIPLISKSRLVGALFFGSHMASAYDQQSLEFLLPIADHVAVAVDNARLMELVLRRSRQVEIINHIGKQLNSALDAERLCAKAIYLLRDNFPYKYIDIFRLNEAKTSLIRTTHQEYDLFRDRRPASLTMEEGIVGRAARTGQTILLNDVQSDAEYVRGFEDSTAEVATPLRWDEEVFGVLNIEDIGSHKFTEDEKILIEAVASQISLALKNANLFEQIRKSKVYLELILNAAEDTSIISLDKSGRIIMFNSGSERLLGIPAAGATGRLISEVIQSKRTRSVFRSLSGKAKLERWEGELKVLRPDKKSFWAHIIVWPIEPAADLLVGFLIILTDVTQRVELENKLKQLTVTDDLTGIYNQRHFLEQLRREMERANRRNQPFSLCLFDLDKFKVYNDTYGHVAGDQILRSVGMLVSKAIRARVDSAFRYGGDEFVLLLPDTRLGESAVLVERLRKAIRKEFDGEISISAGIAEYVQGMEQEEFIEAADRLMYLAKRKGGDKVVVEMTKKLSHS